MKPKPNLTPINTNFSNQPDTLPINQPSLPSESTIKVNYQETKRKPEKKKKKVDSFKIDPSDMGNISIVPQKSQSQPTLHPPNVLFLEGNVRFRRLHEQDFKETDLKNHVVDFYNVIIG
jgi:hypothetical protein